MRLCSAGTTAEASTPKGGNLFPYTIVLQHHAAYSGVIFGGSGNIGLIGGHIEPAPVRRKKMPIDNPFNRLTRLDLTLSPPSLSATTFSRLF